MSKRRVRGWERPVAPPVPSRRADGGVLLVESNDTVRRIIRLALEHAGYDVRAVADCSEAISMLAEGDPDVLIVDSALNDGSGLDLVRRARHNETPPAAIIVVSGLRQETAVVKAFEAGADDYLTTPISPGELVTRVRRRAVR